MRSVYLLCAVAGVLLAGSAARAEQFVLVDEIYVHEGGSHKALPLMNSAPPSWKTPVDYTTGRVYFRLDVMKKPNNTTPQIYQVCMNSGNGSACGPQGKFSTTGVVEWDAQLPFSYTTGTYDWTKGPYAFRGITKDTKNHNIDPGVEFDGAPDVSLYLPLTVRFTVWVVRNGSTFDRNTLPPVLPPIVRDGGVADGGSRGADGGAARPDSALAPLDTGSAMVVDASAGQIPVARPDVGVGVDAPAVLPTPPTTAGDDAGKGEAHGGSGCTYGGGASPSAVALALVMLIGLHRGTRARRG